MGKIIGFGTLEEEKARLIKDVGNYRSDIKELAVKEIEKNYEIIRKYLIKRSSLNCPEICKDFERKRLNNLIEEYSDKMETSSDRILEAFFPNDERIDDIDCLYMKGHLLVA
jgi:hypothetical protein